MNKRILLLMPLFICFLLKTSRVNPMIVVQGSVQLWPVTIINNSNVRLIVIDEIIDPEGSSVMKRILNNVTPNNQFTFQWPDATQKPTARKVTIYGKVYGVLTTNKIIIGNTHDATHPMVPSGDFSIISASQRYICIADDKHPNQCAGR